MQRDERPAKADGKRENLPGLLGAMTKRHRGERSALAARQRIERLRIPCPMCQRVALVRLPQSLLAFETDGTNVVCHPALGGCNHGFEAPKC